MNESQIEPSSFLQHWFLLDILYSREEWGSSLCVVNFCDKTPLRALDEIEFWKQQESEHFVVMARRVIWDGLWVYTYIRYIFSQERGVIYGN